jgi:hypothetical protein
MPSELLLLVLPSVDSRLPWRVTRLRISTAMPVSVLRRMLLRSFLVAPSGNPRPQEERGNKVSPWLRVLGKYCQITLWADRVLTIGRTSKLTPVLVCSMKPSPPRAVTHKAD